MDTIKGSIILKAISASADEAQIVTYLGKRAKSIPPGKIPLLLKNLPVVLSRNVPQVTGATVVDQLEQLGARALFISAREEEPNAAPVGAERPTSEHEPPRQAMRAEQEDHLGFQMLVDSLRHVEAQRSIHRAGLEFLAICLMLASVWALNYAVSPHILLAGPYTLPTILSAFLFGRRQALYAAVLSILLVVFLNSPYHGLLGPMGQFEFDTPSTWAQIALWGVILLATAWLTGVLREHGKACRQEIRQAYHGLLLILQHFITLDEDREDHAFRVSMYAARIAAQMGLVKEYIEDIRTAARLHDLGRQKTSRTVLNKVIRLSKDAQVSIAAHLPLGPEHLTPLGDSLARVLPMLITVNETTQRLDILPHKRPTQPLGAKILAVADLYDALLSPGSNRSALSPLEARQQILAKAGSELDAEVVDAFARAFDQGRMELSGAIP